MTNSPTFEPFLIEAGLERLELHGGNAGPGPPANIPNGAGADVSSPLERVSIAGEGDSLEELVAQQGVKPVRFDELSGDFWPDDESVDDFIAAVRSWRDGERPRSKSE